MTVPSGPGATGSGTGSHTGALRPAALDDLPALVELERVCFPGDAWTRGMLADTLASPDAVVLVAEWPDAAGRGGAVVRGGSGVSATRGAPVGRSAVCAYGAAMAAPGAGDADILSIAVDPDARRAGLGTRLVRALLDAARGRRARHCFLEVRADNAPAIALYEGLGFARLGVRRRYYRPDGMDAIVMRCELRPAPAHPVPEAHAAPAALDAAAGPAASDTAEETSP